MKSQAQATTSKRQFFVALRPERGPGGLTNLALNLMPIYSCLHIILQPRLFPYFIIFKFPINSIKMYHSLTKNEHQSAIWWSVFIQTAFIWPFLRITLPFSSSTKSLSPQFLRRVSSALFNDGNSVVSCTFVLPKTFFKQRTHQVMLRFW